MKKITNILCLLLLGFFFIPNVFADELIEIELYVRKGSDITNPEDMILMKAKVANNSSEIDDNRASNLKRSGGIPFNAIRSLEIVENGQVILSINQNDFDNSGEYTRFTNEEKAIALKNFFERLDDAGCFE